jgi:protein-L-isoaspartate(D-aspartate) O-methyltransferase
MVDCQVRPSDVTDSRIIEAMLKVPRELFVPPDRRALAYLDLDLDVSEEASTRRCLIKPAVTARMLQAAAIQETDKVLLVGCATGYIAALVGQFASEVTATEGESALAAKARTALAELGMGKITVQVAAATDGDRAHAPYDVIVLNGATENIPEGLYQQLREGGRLVGIFAATRPPRATIVTHSHEDFGSRPLFDAVAPVLPGLERRPAFVF